MPAKRKQQNNKSRPDSATQPKETAAAAPTKVEPVKEDPPKASATSKSSPVVERAAAPPPPPTNKSASPPPPTTPLSGNPEDNVIIGIDLGTTYSCVSVWRNGQVEILENVDGERTTPSWVAFTEEGQRLVGQPAKAQAPRNSTRTFSNIKRIIGQTFAESFAEIKGFPFPVVENKSNGMPMIEVEFADTKRQFSPEEISAMVLEKMKTAAEAALGHTIKKAVITVPAYFNDAQRRSTKAAGAIAGLQVERIINEPTAAALAYGLDKKGEGIILVFDLGGGTFDVSLLRIEQGIFQVLATAGDTHLGGEDFDFELQEYLRSEFRSKNGGSDPFVDNAKALRQLRNQCEKAKRTLSTSTVAVVEVAVDGDEKEISVSRATFEKLNDKHFERCLTMVKRVMDDAKMSKDKVDEVVLVGGSTRIPKVQQMLQDFFGGKRLSKSVNPDEAVAYGAAVQGAILAGVRDQNMLQLVLLDVIPLTLGIETEGKVFAKVVPRNTPVPCSRTREFTTVEDYQTVVDIHVYEGERGCTDGNHLLGNFDITGIERAKQGVAKIEVTFNVNANGMLNVAARDRVTGAKADITIKDRTRHSDDDIERMIKDAARMRLEDEKREKEIEEKLARERGYDDDDDENEQECKD